MTQIKTKIPAELEPAAVGGMVTDSKYVKDRVKNKTQEEVNADTEERVSKLEESVGTGGSVDERIAEEGAKHYLKTETYSKTELNNMITTPSQEYVTVTATDQTTAVTDVLPATGEADTIYRVGNWDGTQYDTTCYTEYAWNGSAYIPLDTKEYGVDDKPIAGSKNLIESNAVYNIIPIGNILDYASRHTNKAINGTYGYEVDSPLWDATTFILLEPNTKYYCYGFYSKGFYGFYTAAQESTFVSSPDVTITTDGDYKCTIETGPTSYYFRCSLSKDNGANSYISKYYNDYSPYNEKDYSAFIGRTNNRVSALETKETMLGKKVLVIGDSISTDDLSYTYFRNHSSIYPEYQNYNNYGYYNKWVIDLVNEKFLPTDVDNNSIHATGFVRHLGDFNNDFVTRLKNIDNPSQYDLVIIFGGINDFIGNIPLGESGQDYNTYFKPAVDEFFNYLINNFTQARLCVLLPLRTDNLYPNGQGVKQEVYDEYIKEVAESYCLPILNLTKESGFCPWNATFKAMWTFHGQSDEYPQGDGVHPNANYQLKYLSQQIKGFIKELL